MPSAKITNTTPFTTYSMTVQAKNAIGYGPESPNVYAQFNGCQYAALSESFSTNVEFTTLENPFGDGTNYKLARFKPGAGVLAIEREGVCDFLIVGGGSGGNSMSSNNGGNHSGGGKGRGGQIAEAMAWLPEGTKNVTVGAGGAGSVGSNNSGAGGRSDFLGMQISGGAAATWGLHGAGSAGSGREWTSDITGTSVIYSLKGGGDPGHCNPRSYGSGGNMRGYEQKGCSGEPGVVYVRVKV